MIAAIESLVMTEQEAQEWKARVKEQANQLRIVLYDGYKRQVWIPLGYTNWSECVRAIADEFGFSENYIWRLHIANQIESNLLAPGQVGTIPEKQLRPLASLEPEQRREVWALAVQTAPDGKVTASHVERVVQQMISDDDMPDDDMLDGCHNCAHFQSNSDDGWCTLLERGITLEASFEYCMCNMEEWTPEVEIETTDLAVHFSSKTDDWSTPQALFDLLNDEFNFTLDVCASEQNHKCKKYYAEEDNGLIKTWRGVCWMNPPYGDVIAAWVEKAFQSAIDGATVVCLVPARTDTRWWWDFCIHGEVRFLKGRLKFNDAGSAPFPSALVIFRDGLSKRDRRVVWWDKWGNNEQDI